MEISKPIEENSLLQKPGIEADAEAELAQTAKAEVDTYELSCNTLHGCMVPGAQGWSARGMRH